MIAAVRVLPESPRWLLAHGHEAEGQRVVAALLGVSVTDEAAVAEHNLITEGLKAQASKKAAKKEILKGGKNQHLRRALVGASTQLFQQLGGCNAGGST